MNVREVAAKWNSTQAIELLSDQRSQATECRIYDRGLNPMV